MNNDTLKTDLKQMIVEECDMTIAPDEIDDDEYLLGSQSRLNLDSLDALSISLEVKRRYGRHIDSGNETRLALTSISILARFINGESLHD